MIPFAYHRPESADAAVATVEEHPDAVYLGGGTNLVDHMKLGVAAPRNIVDISRLPLSGITAMPGGGVRIGANERNADAAADPVIRSRYPMLARAMLSGASGQIRNLATTGGNLLQRTRCVYFQDITTPCNKREPGTGCSAFGGYVRYHAILGASDQCVAVHPSDMAVALCALDADVLARDGQGEHRIPITEFYRLPGNSPERDTTLPHGALITAVEVPAPPARARSDYYKVRDRASYAFALTSVAAELVVENGIIRSARIALGGVAHGPWRARRAEEVLLREATPTEQNFLDAADAELEGAKPLAGNEFKVDLTRRTLFTVLRSLTAGARE